MTGQFLKFRMFFSNKHNELWKLNHFLSFVSLLSSQLQVELLDVQSSVKGNFQDTKEKLEIPLKRLSNDHAKIIYCIDELGLLCAYEVSLLCSWVNYALHCAYILSSVFISYIFCCFFRLLKFVRQTPQKLLLKVLLFSGGSIISHSKFFA